MKTAHPEPDEALPRSGATEDGTSDPGATHTVVEGDTPLRLPHEHDESSDSGTREPSEDMVLAAEDAKRGHSDAPRGPTTQQRYSELTEQAQAEAESPEAHASRAGSQSRQTQEHDGR